MRPFLRVARVFPEVGGRFPAQQRASFNSASSKARARASGSSSSSSSGSGSGSGSGKLPTGTPGEASDQAIPLGPYYESILIKPQPVPDVKPEGPPTSSPKSPRTTVKKAPPRKPKDSADKKPTSSAASAPTTSNAPQPSAPPSTAQEKARIIFGSQLAGPIERAERLAALRDRSTWIAGVLVPPQPEEPDNCCMSGCVNCVWDRFRDDMEEWVAASLEAEKALQTQSAPRIPDGADAIKDVPAMQGANAASMDDDGGGNETSWQADLEKADTPKISKDLWDDKLYKNIPVGIREFMKQEKRLKEKHMREGTFGA